MAVSTGNSLFIQFAREPLAGSVKTRMMPHLSPREACALHSELVLWTARSLVGAGLGAVELAVTGALEHPLFDHCRELGLAGVGAQRGAHLGERMYNALVDGLGRFERVILIGSDCPGIDRDYLQMAVRALDGEEVVLGPALDGGYVLIGARRIYREIFEGITWGSDTVLAETRQRLRRSAVTWAELPALADIDRPEDLAVWESLQQAASGHGAGLRR
jgi:rSAM/selenodomain-associated transferase 1